MNPTPGVMPETSLPCTRTDPLGRALQPGYQGERCGLAAAGRADHRAELASAPPPDRGRCSAVYGAPLRRANRFVTRERSIAGRRASAGCCRCTIPLSGGRYRPAVGGGSVGFRCVSARVAPVSCDRRVTRGFARSLSWSFCSVGVACRADRCCDARQRPGRRRSAKETVDHVALTHAGVADPARRAGHPADHVGLGGFLYVRLSGQTLDQQYQQRALGIANTVAQMPDIVERSGHDPSHGIQAIAERVRLSTGAAYVVVDRPHWAALLAPQPGADRSAAGRAGRGPGRPGPRGHRQWQPRAARPTAGRRSRPRRQRHRRRSRSASWRPRLPAAAARAGC